jgi:hypothetical protein
MTWGTSGISILSSLLFESSYIRKFRVSVTFVCSGNSLDKEREYFSWGMGGWLAAAGSRRGRLLSLDFNWPPLSSL